MTRCHLKDVASPIEFKAAAIEEEFFQLAASALDARFCTGWREAKSLSHFVLGQALPLGEQQGFAVGGLQLVHELSNAWAEVGQVGGDF